MNWQPIETAPKDGSMILLGRGPIEDCDAISVPGFWQEGWDDSIDDMGCDSGFVDVHFQEFGGGRSFGAEKYQRAPNQPTHWMPLPAAPGAEPQGPAMDADGERYPAPAAPSEAEIAAAREHISDVHNATQMRSALSQLRPEVVVELVARGLVPSIYAPMAAAPQAPAAPTAAALDIDRAAKKLAELFDYPWEHMLADGRQNMRKNAEAVLLAACFKESP